MMGHLSIQHQKNINETTKIMLDYEIHSSHLFQHTFFLATAVDVMAHIQSLKRQDMDIAVPANLSCGLDNS